MRDLPEHPYTVCVGLLVSATLVGCVSPQALPDANDRSGYVFVGAGASRFDPDEMDETLEVTENTSASAHLGLGYQINSNSAVELRAAQLGGVEYEDGRELDYQLVDATGLLMLRHKNASVFARLGVGTFRNEGDFDVELNDPVHPVIGAGLIYHAAPNVDLRLSMSRHNVDAIWSKLSLVWRFSSRPSSAPIVVAKNNSVVFEGNESDGFQSVEPIGEELQTDVKNTESAPLATTANSGLQIEKKPLPTLQTEPASTLTQATAAPLDQIRLPNIELLPGESIQAEAAPLVSKPEPVVEEPSSTQDVVSNLSLTPDTVLPIGPLMFEQGRAILIASSRADLEELVDVLTVNPTLQLNVEAHASPVGNSELNMLLSRRRALAVIRLLVDAGIEATRLRPQAFGDTAPLPNAASIDLNDRIELRVR